MTIILDTSIFSKNKEYRYFKFYRNLIENFIMKVIRKIYVLTFIISTVATYALIFGDVGYIKRNQIKDELKYLENSVSLLRRENLFLKEEYNSIKKNGLVRETKKSAEKWDITILKFDDQEEQLELFSLDKGGKEYTLDTITVRATKTKQKTFDLPGMTSVIDLDSPSLIAPATMSDLFVSEPWLDFIKSARHNGQAPAMRGYREDAVLILFDGLRQNFLSTHDGVFFIDPSLVKRVEVIRGPRSALYGNGALGGVIAFETANAADLLRSGQNFGALLKTAYQSASSEFLGTASAFGRKGALDWLVSYSYRQSEDIELGDDLELPAKDFLNTILSKFSWTISDYHTIKASTQIYSNDSRGKQ